MLAGRESRYVGRRDRRRSFANVGKAFLLLALAVEAAFVIQTMSKREPSADSPGSSSEVKSAHGRAIEYESNERAGYSFAYPKRWKIDIDATLSEVRSPNGDAVVLLGVGTNDPINVASSEFMTTLRETYPEVTWNLRRRMEIGDAPAVLMLGTVVNMSGTEVEFVSATVKGDPRNYQIAGYYDSRKGGKVGRLVHDILESFRRRTSL